MPKSQMEIPGTERPKIKPIEDAAEAYVSLRDKRMKLLEQEIAAKLALIMTMQKHEDKLDTNEEGDYCYRYDEELVILSDKTTVKVKRQSDGDEESED